MLEVGGGLDLAQEALGADDGGEFGAEDLDGDGAIVLEVVREVDRGHAALAELALDAVAVGQCRGSDAFRGRQSLGGAAIFARTSVAQSCTTMAWTESDTDRSSRRRFSVGRDVVVGVARR